MHVCAFMLVCRRRWYIVSKQTWHNMFLTIWVCPFKGLVLCRAPEESCENRIQDIPSSLDFFFPVYNVKAFSGTEIGWAVNFWGTREIFNPGRVKQTKEERLVSALHTTGFYGSSVVFWITTVLQSMLHSLNHVLGFNCMAVFTSLWPCWSSLGDFFLVF